MTATILEHDTGISFKYIFIPLISMQSKISMLYVISDWMKIGYIHTI